jgi:putative two-component system response regulator
MVSLESPPSRTPPSSRTAVAESQFSRWRDFRHHAAYRDPCLFACIRDHSLRVGHYSLLLSRQLGLGEAEAGLLASAAILHDVGLLALPAALLNKPGPFGPREWDAVRNHTWLGAAALHGLGHPLLEAARELALCHHERWDGSGYPLGLHRHHIPLASRIVALADQYDALRSPRPYKPAYHHEEACAVLLKGDDRTAPHHFDPRVLAAFLAVHQQFRAVPRLGEG